LTSNLTDLYNQWSDSDPNFKKKALNFTGIRILRQDAWEALVSFICSSNNNIARISQMVEKLCTNYGNLVATIDDRAYHDFPAPEALTGKDVEARLRELGFGYRAKYIYQTAVMVLEKEKGWLDSLRNPESPAFGVAPSPGGEMHPEGREGYRDAHEKLLELQGVGPKVADCVCLMGLGWGEAVPVDTHG
jgi:N-glycosylase/DNA lyase